MNDRSTFNDPQLDSLYPEFRFDRRGFIASSVATGFALTAGPLMAQQLIRTPATGLDVGDAQVPASPGYLPIYFAAPAKPGKYPVVVVIPEIWGLHEYQKDICRRLAGAGYLAVTLDPFFRSGDLAKMTDIKEVIAKANSLEDKQMLADLDAVVAFIEQQPRANAKKLGIQEIEVYLSVGPHGYTYFSSTGPREGRTTALVMERLTYIADHLRARDPAEVPSEPGVCLDVGFIADDNIKFFIKPIILQDYSVTC